MSNTAQKIEESTPTNLLSRDHANAIRLLAADAVQQANSGHPGMPMGFADVATTLFSGFLKFDAGNPKWFDRDRFVLSVGHGSMLLYSLLYLTGYEDMPIDQIKNFRQLHSNTPGHPEFEMGVGGIETTTGPLGQGLGNAVGMALGERILNAKFGDELVDHYTYCVVGDGCLMEGISHESLSMAGHLKLNKLIVLFDDNNISIDGSTELSVSDDQCKRAEACGFDTWKVDGHNPGDIAAAIEAAKKSDKPAFIACRTTIGQGAPNKQGTASTHGAPLGDDEIAATRETLGWPHAPFEVPETILADWRAVGQKGAAQRHAWEARLAAHEHKDCFEKVMNGEFIEDWESLLQAHIDTLVEDQPKVATRKASGMALDVLVPAIPQLVGGSADLTGSNLTKAKDAKAITPDDFDGNYIHYGVREHAMAAAMNGLSLHGGFIPFGGTFLVFTDYCRPSIRLSALMRRQVIYVMTHDSIGLGEDGPTHQPVEHLTSLRAMPNVNVYRPCDAVETAECWAAALKTPETPSILALSRQGLPTVRTEKSTENLCEKGAYVLSDAQNPKATIIATGSEVEIALAAQKHLADKGIGARVVSMPCRELFDAQPAAYRESVVNRDTFCVAIEAASPYGWDTYADAVIGMTGFGASAPAKDLYPHFGLTAGAVVEKVEQNLS